MYNVYKHCFFPRLLREILSCGFVGIAVRGGTYLYIPYIAEGGKDSSWNL